ncbi:MAG: hypothetical protein QOJ27_1265 [Sphingomonadales bacterium]|jgi:hypothetical protein|nr:hypothetical protein [Sphingomonadales bacterium]
MADPRDDDVDPPVPLPPSFDDVRPLPEQGVEFPPVEFMAGTWVGSFASFVHDEPRDGDSLATQLAGYKRDGDNFVQVAGFFVSAALLTLRFLPDTTLVGEVFLNRGGRQLLRQDKVEGRWVRYWNPRVQVAEGYFQTLYPPPGGGTGRIQTNYYFVAKSWHELEWLWLSSTRTDSQGVVTAYRANVGRGTLTRVTTSVVPGPKEPKSAPSSAPSGGISTSLTTRSDKETSESRYFE